MTESGMKMEVRQKSSVLHLVVVCICIGAASSATRDRRASDTSPFADLSISEMTSIHDYLYKQKELNLASQLHAKITDSYIFLIEAIRPKKAEALKFLDENGPSPQRAARVVIFRGDLSKPVVEEYKVFPIPNPTNHQLLVHPGWRQPIPFNSRSPFNLPQMNQFGAFIETELAKVNDLLAEASGHTFYSNCTEKCLTILPGLPPTAEMNHHQLIIYLVKEMEGSYLHPIGLQFVLNMDSVNDKEWSIDYVWFQGQAFRNFNHLKEERSTGKVQVNRVQDPHGMNDITLSSSLNFRGDPRPEKIQRGPRTVMPDGNRFTVNGRHISWQGWDFDISMLSSTGIEVYDVKFLKQRIAYELSLQEIGVFYSGGSPVPQHTTYYDSFVNIGQQTSEMFYGIDCPKHAEFFDFVHYLHGKPHLYKNGACVFEQDIGVPLRRHYASDHMGGYKYAQGMAGNVLIFRHVLAVYNYDYVIDFIFHQAGQIEGKVTLSGYLLNTYYTGPEMKAYGHVVNVETSLANIHHHVIHLKADLDIMGQTNRFETLDISLENVDDPLNPGFKIYNRVFKKNLRMTEKQAAYKFNFNQPKYLVVSNEMSKNKFGYPRSYRILSEGISKMLLPEDYRAGRSRSWTNYQAAVTKYKDEERKSSTLYSTMEPYDPVMSFQDFIDDDEDIVDQDLVAWLTLGTHHIPHSEDVPIVTSPGVQLRFYLLPYNYFDEDPSLASRDNIRVTPDGKGGNKYHYAGFKESDEGDGGNDNSPSSGFRNSPLTQNVLIVFFTVMGIMMNKVMN